MRDKRINFKLTKELHLKFKSKCSAECTNMQQKLEQLVIAWVEKGDRA